MMTSRLKCSPEKLFFIVFVLYFFFDFFFPMIAGFGGSILLFGLFLYCSMVAFRESERYSFFSFNFLFLFCFCSLCITMLLLSNNFKVMHIVFFLYLYLFSFSAKILTKNGSHRFVSRAILVFTIFQLIVVLGQAAKIHSGVGFDVPASREEGIAEAYLLMTPGTFFNKNNLSAVMALVFVYFFIFGHRFGFDLKSRLGLGVSLLLVFATTSRASLLVICLFLLVYVVTYRLKRSFFYIPLATIIFFGIWIGVSEYRDTVVPIDIAMSKMESIVSVVKHGVSSENSTSVRLFSYVNFLENFGHLGLGSGEFKNYGEYIPGDVVNREMLASVPHSLIVELGYWGGWPLLILFFLSIFSLKVFGSMIFFSFMMAFIALTFVSSSVIGNFAFFWVFFNIFHLVASAESPSKYDRRPLNTVVNCRISTAARA